jgi:RNA polymerase sigma factor (sigma-70 family)
MQEPSDEQLMNAWAAGQMTAFEQLHARYRIPLYRYLLRHAGEDSLANDLYQGCWEKVILARQRYRPNGPFRAWLFRVAHNHVMDHFRRRRPTSELRADRLESANPGPDERLESSGRKERLLAAIAELPAEQRDTLLLKIDAGLDLDAIAQVTGVNRETAKSRLRYAVRKLRQMLTEPTA